MNTIHLQIPAQADFIDMVRICLYGIASKMNFSYEEIEDMKVAVSEACNNAVLHGFRDVERDVIDICYELEQNSLTIKVRNSGTGFVKPNGAGRRDPLHEGEISELQVGGLGIYLMEALMDEVVVHATDTGTEVIMTKYVTA